MEMVLLNVFHGAADRLETGWTDDVAELKDMALWNIVFGESPAVVHADWKEELSKGNADPQRLVRKLVLPEHGVQESSGVVKFLDGSRNVPHNKKWSGVSEFLSGNSFNYLTEVSRFKEAFEDTEWFNLVVNNRKEYQLMRLVEKGTQELSRSLWLLVAMNRRSADLRHGRVIWTKVIAGKKSSLLRRALENEHLEMLKDVIGEHEGDATQMNVTSLRKVEPNVKPAWTVLFPVAGSGIASPSPSAPNSSMSHQPPNGSLGYGQVPWPPPVLSYGYGGAAPQGLVQGMSHVTPLANAQWLHLPSHPPLGSAAQGSAPLMNPPAPQDGYAPASSNISRYRPSGRKKALLIGNNCSGSSELKGCVRDVTFMVHLLRTKFHFRDSDVFVMTDKPSGIQNIHSGRPTRKGILQAMHWLVDGARAGDSLFFHFSGHGSQVKDTSSDEADGYDETILPMDYQSAGHIVDDEIYDIMVRNLASDARLTAVMDCCHIGTGMGLPFIFYSGGHGQGMDMQLDMQQLERLKKSTKTVQRCLGLNPHTGEVLLFFGCRDNQIAEDTSQLVTGAVTYCVIEAIENGSVRDWYRYTYRSLLHEMREKLRAAKLKQVLLFCTSHQFNLSSPFIN